MLKDFRVFMHTKCSGLTVNSALQWMTYHRKTANKLLLMIGTIMKEVGII
jgi:hypothetical protein